VNVFVTKKKILLAFFVLVTSKHANLSAASGLSAMSRQSKLVISSFQNGKGEFSKRIKRNSDSRESQVVKNCEA
jgi:hypothetical protein